MKLNISRGPRDLKTPNFSAKTRGRLSAPSSMSKVPSAVGATRKSLSTLSGKRTFFYLVNGYLYQPIGRKGPCEPNQRQRCKFPNPHYLISCINNCHKSISSQKTIGRTNNSEAGRISCVKKQAGLVKSDIQTGHRTFK